ncbi:MAG TPA: sigma-70 family RNA polymerase sigma factor [Opitutaceae bacterium]|nr:sigma-70 family RNA polymerase sigma factor [Opitutaceae bacterium]
MSTDAELLRRFADERAEAAFAELVQRHLPLVYFAALRQLGGDAHAAEDVAQTVFADLARKARTLANHATLAGWLHTSTRFASAKMRRAEASRHRHEQESELMHALHSGPNPAADWERLRPLIDEAIHELDERDRDAVLLRFFEGRAFAEIGAMLHASEDAARMRVDRALEKLRRLLARRGVNSTAAALALAFANHAGARVPPGLAPAITGAALAGGGGAAAAGVGAGIFMSTKSTVIVAVVALAAIGSTFLQWDRARRAEAESDALALERDSLRAQMRTEQQRAARAAQDVAALQADVASLQAKQAAAVAPVEPSAASSAARPTQDVTLGMAKWEIQQAALNNLRQIDAARRQFKLEKGDVAGSIHDLVGRGAYIKTVRTVDGEDYSKLSMNPADPLTVTTPNGVTVTFDPTSLENTTKPDWPPEVARFNELNARMQPSIGQAVNAYRSANSGKNPPNEQALVPYFATPKDGADFVELLEAKKAAGL